MLSSFQKRNVLGMAGVICTLAIPYFIGRADPHIETSQSLCPTKLLTGLPCPGCGITKSFIFFYQGDLEKSFYYHAFGPITIIASVALLVLLAYQLILNKAFLKQVIYNTKLAYLLGVGLLLYHGSRLILFIQTHSIAEILKESIWN